ncbi:MAG: TPM domain-containing protein [Candidatus Dojkabacteria bacterium]|nr:TPM domain-containing protein [Candidatus Dojkabacteria bacterium]
MKKVLAVFLTAIVCIAVAGVVSGLNDVRQVIVARFDFPDPVGYVNDFADVLSNDEELNRRLSEFDTAESTQILVITVDTLPDDVVLEEFVPLLTDEHPLWRAGQEEYDNGVIFTVVVDDRDMRIDVGYGLEGALPDITAHAILDNEVRPEFREGDYDGGVDAGVTAIMQAVTGEYTGESLVSDTDFDGDALGSMLALCCPIVFLIFGPYVAAFLGRTKSWWLGGVLAFFLSLIVAVVYMDTVNAGWIEYMSLVCFPLIFTPLGLLFDFILSKTYKVRKNRGLSTAWTRSWGGFSSGGFGGGFGGGGGGGFSGGGGSFGGGGSSSGW